MIKNGHGKSWEVTEFHLQINVMITYFHLKINKFQLHVGPTVIL